MEWSLLHSLSLFLRSPSKFFEEHEPATTLPVAIGIVVTFAIVLVLSVYRSTLSKLQRRTTGHHRSTELSMRGVRAGIRWKVGQA
ncbi:hypothetical protein C482_01415 [Natrialba chahannaoensis JCM 10990]|uniref:Uncharacterized protein n=1 Tax=Natrialba chahannaoensis JCM 10990 TaxID=1227492 RepID=M0B7F1_9EURY|nr:hypothetical protein C482_01415 [Natrialba chahannaoensis JCM 10990]